MLEIYHKFQNDLSLSKYLLDLENDKGLIMLAEVLGVEIVSPQTPQKI